MASDLTWQNNLLQFARLLGEIWAVGLTPNQYRDLEASMSLSRDQIDELFLRAEGMFEAEKKLLFDPKRARWVVHVDADEVFVADRIDLHKIVLPDDMNLELRVKIAHLLVIALNTDALMQQAKT